MKIDPVAVLIVLMAAGYWWYQRGFWYAVATVIVLAAFWGLNVLWERKPRVAIAIALAVTLPIIALILLGLFSRGAQWPLSL